MLTTEATGSSSSPDTGMPLTVWILTLSAFAFGVVFLRQRPQMQMRVMRHGGAAPELAATANLSAFNVANALGRIFGGAVVDSSVGAAGVPFAAAVIPVAGLAFIVWRERHGPGSSVASAMP